MPHLTYTNAPSPAPLIFWHKITSMAQYGTKYNTMSQYGRNKKEWYGMDCYAWDSTDQPSMTE